LTRGDIFNAVDGLAYANSSLCEFQKGSSVIFLWRWVAETNGNGQRTQM